MAEKTQKIGIFDSGLGGTTVLKEMIKSLPNEDYIYYGDNGNFPYGSGKTKNELQKLTERILDFFVKNNCKLVIVACNTASTAAIDYLREKFSLPIIGIVEAGVKIASKTTKNKNIAVISTKFTAESHGYKNKAKMLDSELNVKEIACIEFAQMIESGWDTFDNRKELLNKNEEAKEIFIMGGGQIYKQFMENNLADRLLLTKVNASFEADTYFPQIDDTWKVKESFTEVDNGFETEFVIYEKA